MHFDDLLNIPQLSREGAVKRIAYDADGDPEFIGLAQSKSKEADPHYRIMKVTYGLVSGEKKVVMVEYNMKPNRFSDRENNSIMEWL